MNLLVLASGLTEIRPGLIFWTLVTFGLVILVLRAKAWKPIIDLVEERERQITNAIESAKKERAEAERLLAEQKTAIAEARREAAELMRKNQVEVERFRQELIAKSRKEADELMASAMRQIQEEKIKALNEVKSRAVDLAIDVASKLIEERLDDNKHRSMAEQFANQLPQHMGTQPRTLA